VFVQHFTADEEGYLGSMLDPGHLLKVDVGRYDPEILALFEDSIQLFAVTDAVCVFVVEKDRRPVVRTNLMERVAGEVFVTHDLLVGELVDGLFHAVEITFELFLDGISPPVKKLAALL
jgi:hypothetical protein